MKKLYKNHPLILGFGIILSCLLLSNLGEGDELEAVRLSHFFQDMR